MKGKLVCLTGLLMTGLLACAGAMAQSLFTIATTSKQLPFSYTQTQPAVALYQITNSANLPQSLYIPNLAATPGVTQALTGDGPITSVCTPGIQLASGASCTLRLIITAPLSNWTFRACPVNDATSGFCTLSTPLSVQNGSPDPSHAVRPYVSVGQSSAIATSTDLRTWTPQTPGISTDLYSITSNAKGGVSMAVGDGGVILKSTNGINWIMQNNPAFSTASQAMLNSIIPAGTGYVTVGYSCNLSGQNGGKCGNLVLLSTDGVTWNVQYTDASSTDNGGEGLNQVIDGGSGYYVAVGDSGVLLQSIDGGVTWNPPKFTLDGTPNLNSVVLTSGAGEAGQYIAVGDTGTISADSGTLLYSTDGGANWNTAGPAKSVVLPATNLLSVAATGTTSAVAVGASGTILNSTDGQGQTWSVATIDGDPITANLNSVVADGSNHYVAVGDSGVILYSNDGGANWIQEQNPIKCSSACNLTQVIYDGSNYIIIGQSGTILTNSDPSKNDWQIQHNPDWDMSFGQDLKSIVWNGSQYLTVGTGTLIQTSGVKDFTTWSLQFLGALDLLNVIYVPANANNQPQQYVAIGGDNADPCFYNQASCNSKPKNKGSSPTLLPYILYSSDGMTWSLASFKNTVKPATEGQRPVMMGIAYGNGIYVAVGEYGTIFASSDGAIWEQEANPAGGGGVGAVSPLDLYNVIWSGTQFVATGECSVILTSPDGLTWTMKNGNPTTCGKPPAVAKSQSASIRAPGAQGCNSLSCGLNPGGTVGSLAYNGTQYVAVGTTGIGGATLLTSSDGSTWVRVVNPAPFLSGPLINVTYDSALGQFTTVTGGLLGLLPSQMVTSTDGMTWKIAATLPVMGYPYLFMVGGSYFLLPTSWSLSVQPGTILKSPDLSTWQPTASSYNTALLFAMT